MNTQLLKLDHYEFVRVSGRDAVSFLQGQISANMDLLTHTRCLPAALCNLKGRVIADFRVSLDGEDCLLQTGQGMAQIIIDTLAKYAVFSQLTLSKDSSIQVLGINTAALPDPLFSSLTANFPTLPQHSNSCIHSAGALLLKSGGMTHYQLWMFEKFSGSDSFAQLFTQLFTDAPSFKESGAEASHWLRGEIEAGVIHIGLSTTEKYTPQLLNYDISGVIDFNKGCYTGQEVVARMFYRGKVKKRLYLLNLGQFKVEHDNLPLRIVHPEGQDPLEILASASAQQEAQDNLVLAILPTSIAEEGNGLRLNDQGASAIKLMPLLYL